MQHYIFDKRIIKKLFKKYILIFAAIFPIVVAFNFLMPKTLSSTLRIVLDMLLICILLGAIEIIIRLINNKNEANKNK
jgi:antibiotic biosynthesis monooxygenase (ABM) superfamily enzyme